MLVKQENEKETEAECVKEKKGRLRRKCLWDS